MICPYCGNLVSYNSYFDVFYCSDVELEDDGFTVYRQKPEEGTV